MTPHAVLEVRTGAGDLVWRFDRDGKKPLQAIPPSVAADMAGMMSHVVSEGTARRAALGLEKLEEQHTVAATAEELRAEQNALDEIAARSRAEGGAR